MRHSRIRSILACGLLTACALVAASGLGFPLGWPASPAGPQAEQLDSAAAESEATKPVAIFVLRHAEKAQDQGRDPSLSDAGRERAQVLARLLGSTGVSHLFASEYKRTQETLAPLAKRSGLEVVSASARESAELAKRLRALPGGSIAVVAGHSNTVPELVQHLGGSVSDLVDSPYGKLIEEQTYDRLFQVILPGAGRAVQCMELRYGSE